MKPGFSAILYATAIALGLSGVAIAQSDGASTSDAGTSAALETQTTQMDALATSRGETQVMGRTADTFTAFAGSRDNAVSLVTGLRKGSEITLTSSSNGSDSSTSTSFTPVTRPMGNGNVFNSLALAQQLLASQGITDPTPEQIEAALNGGEITIGEGADAKTIDLKGVLELRAEGMGWGRIAQVQGTKLGHIVSALRSANAAIAKQPNVVTTTTPSGTTEGSGVTTAAGGRTAAGKYSTDAKGKGIVDGSGRSASSSGASGSRGGIQNAMGGNAHSGNGNAYGKTKSQGIVTATGAGVGGSSTGAGIVSAGGSSGGVSANAASHGQGIVSGGGGQGQGNAYGRSKKPF